MQNAGSAFIETTYNNHTPYFSVGVLLIDTIRRRTRRIKERAVVFLSRHADAVKFWDQDVLNFVMVDDWMELGLRWNHASDYHQHDRMQPPPPFSVEEWRSREQPYVAHFVYGYKSWTHFRHPNKQLSDRYLCEAGYRSHRMTMWRALA